MLPLLEVSPVRLPGAVDELLDLHGKLRGVLDAVRVPFLSDCYLITVHFRFSPVWLPGAVDELPDLHRKFCGVLDAVGVRLRVRAGRVVHKVAKLEQPPLVQQPPRDSNCELLVARLDGPATHMTAVAGECARLLDTSAPAAS